jgi:hypothetical protein
VIHIPWDTVLGRVSPQGKGSRDVSKDVENPSVFHQNKEYPGEIKQYVHFDGERDTAPDL